MNTILSVYLHRVEERVLTILSICPERCTPSPPRHDEQRTNTVCMAKNIGQEVCKYIQFLVK